MNCLLNSMNVERIYNKNGREVTKEYYELLNNKSITFGKYILSDRKNDLAEMIQAKNDFDKFCKENFN